MDIPHGREFWRHNTVVRVVVSINDPEAQLPERDAGPEIHSAAIESPTRASEVITLQCGHNVDMAPTMNRQLSRVRAEQAERMHATGATWQEIADALGFASRKGAQMAVQRLRNATPPETVEQARAKHDSTLRLLQQRMFSGFLRADQARDDETAVKYAKEIRGLVGDRAKLCGVVAPQRAEVDVIVTETPAALLAETRQRLMAAIDAEVIDVKEIEQ